MPNVKPVQLGPFQIDHPFLLAPMAGITNSPFRRLMRRRRSSLVISELVSANGIEYASEKTMDLLKFHEEERVVGLQIFGEDTERLCKAAQVVERLGADFVDLNMGCPVPKIVKKGAGSAMCRNPLELAHVLRALVKSVKIPFTIKIRTGWDSESKNASEVIRVAEEAGVAWVAIHGRTRAQGYSGEADWDAIGELKSRTKLPIIGNGDLTTPELALGRWKKSGVDAVMIGRGALRNPFIFEQAEALYQGRDYCEPGLDAYLKLIEDQKVLLNDSFEPRSAMIHVRKFLAWYSSGFPGCHEFRSKVFSVAEPEELWSHATEFFKNSFERNSKHRDTQYLSQPFLMGGHG